MNETIKLLTKASELEKAAYTKYVTSYSSSGITALVKGGVPFEKAASLVKEACEKDPKVQNLLVNISAFEKAAELLEVQEQEISRLTKIASEKPVSEIIESDNPLSKLASIGFTKEEIEMMSELPENLLTKVASANSQPWDLGGGVGVAREKTDPILEFILGG